VEAASALLSATRADLAVCEDDASSCERAEASQLAAHAAASSSARARAAAAACSLEALRSQAQAQRRDAADRECGLESRAGAAAAQLTRAQRALEAAQARLEACREQREAQAQAHRAAVEEEQALRARAAAVRARTQQRRAVACGPPVAAVRRQRHSAELFEAQAQALRARTQDAALRREAAEGRLLSLGRAASAAQAPTQRLEALEVRLREASAQLLDVSAQQEQAGSVRSGLLLRLEAQAEVAARERRGGAAVADAATDEEAGGAAHRPALAQPLAAASLHLFHAASALLGRERARGAANALASLDAAVLRYAQPLGRSGAVRAAVFGYVLMFHVYLFAMLTVGHSAPRIQAA